MTLDTEVLADSPIGYWPMNETTGSTFADQSGNGRDMTVAGTVTLGYADGPCDGSSRKAPYFTNGTASTAASTVWQLNNSFTIECWHQALGSSGFTDPGILCFGSGAKTSTDGWLYFWPDRVGHKYYAAKRSNLYVTTSGVPRDLSGCYRHFVWRYDSSSNTASAWLDGDQIQSGTRAYTNLAISAALIAGRNNEYGDNRNNMLLSHVAVYGAALSDARIRAHWREGRCSGCYAAFLPTVGRVGFR